MGGVTRNRARDEVAPVDPVRAILNWRRRGFSDREIVEIVRRDMLATHRRHPVTHAGCAAILTALGDR